MSTLTVSCGSSISHHLRATKVILRCVVFDAKYVWSDGARRVWGTEISVDRIETNPDDTEFDLLEQDALDVLQLIRSWRNRLAPVNQIPPEILTLVPDFWDKHDGKDKDVIALTHVCRAWREVFVSRSSLWTNLDCVDPDKTRVYLERSKLSPINVSLDKDDTLSPCDPFFQIIPCAIGRLRSLAIDATLENIQEITTHLSHPARLEKLSLCAFHEDSPHRQPVLTSTLFNGDLSSLRKLRLDNVCTELPWRNMINLTSFLLARMAPGEITIKQLLDFFESAPNLRKIDLYSAIPTSGAQNRRLVTLPCLEWVYTTGGGASSLLLDHLLIPTGARLTTEVESLGPLIKDRPRFLENLKNLVNFTSIRLSCNKSHPHVRLNGPNGEVMIVLRAPHAKPTDLVLGVLPWFDTSKTERLEIIDGNPLSTDPLHQALRSMKELCTLALYGCKSPHIFIPALHPSAGPLRTVVCPKLMGLVLKLSIDGEAFDIQGVIEMAKARASRGAKLGSVRIIDRNVKPKVDPVDLLELRKYARHVRYGPWPVDLHRSDEEDQGG